MDTKPKFDSSPRIFSVKSACCILAALFCVWLSICSRSAEAWGGKKDLDSVVEKLIKTLASRGGLEGKPVIVSPHDLYESTTGLSALLTDQLRGKIITQLAKRGARVLLPGSDEDSNMILQGTWQRQGDDLGLDFKVTRLGEHGPEVVAAASETIPLSEVDPAALEKNRESYARMMARKLESKTAERVRGRKIFMDAFVIDGKTTDTTGLSTFLSDMFRTAMAESPLFVPIDEKKEMRGLSSEVLRTRATRGISKRQKDEKHPESVEPASLTARLVDADGVLKGKAWRKGKNIVVANVEIDDMEGRMITAASVDIPCEIFPDFMVNPPEKTAVEEIAASLSPHSLPGSDGISKGGLAAQITTDHGDKEPLYRKGEHIRFILQINNDAYVYLFDINPRGEAVLLYPVDENGALAQGRECGSRLSAGKALVLPLDGCSYDLVADEPYGKDIVWAVASSFPLDFGDIAPDDWSNAGILQQKIRNRGISKTGGYAEAAVEIVTGP